MSLYTDGSYLDLNPNWHEEDSPWKAEQIFKIIKRNNLSIKSVCEVGCGVGEILVEMGNKIKSPNTIFHGYDIASKALARAKQKENERIKFFEQDITTINHKYDLMLIIDVVEHIEDYYGFIERLKVKSDYKIFHFPLDISVQTVLRNKPILDRRNTVGHIHYFTKDLALRALIDKGYEIIDYNYTASATELNAKLTFKSLVMQLPRRIIYSLHKDFAVRFLGGYSLLVLAK